MCWGQSLCEMLVQYSPHTPWGYQTGPGRTGTIDHIFTPDPSHVLLPCLSDQSCNYSPLVLPAPVSSGT